MIKINLLPAEAAEKEQKRKYIILGGAAGAAVVGAAIFFFFVQLAVERSLASRVNSLDNELKHYQSIVDEVEKLKAATGTLEARKKIIEDLMKGRLLYPKFMESFMEVLPQGVWLNSMTTLDEASGLKLSLGGYAFDNFGIADFITGMETSGRFTGIELKSVSASSSGGADALQFLIECHYVKPAE